MLRIREVVGTSGQCWERGWCWESAITVLGISIVWTIGIVVEVRKLLGVFLNIREVFVFRVRLGISMVLAFRMVLGIWKVLAVRVVGGNQGCLWITGRAGVHGAG